MGVHGKEATKRVAMVVIRPGVNFGHHGMIPLPSLIPFRSVLQMLSEFNS